MHVIRRKTSVTGQSGFSLMEVLVALAIINFAALIWLCQVWFGPWQFYTFSPATGLNLAWSRCPNRTRCLAKSRTT